MSAITGPARHGEAVERLVGELRDATGSGVGPLDLRQACNARMVEVRRGELTIGERRRTAMLVPFRTGFRVLVDSLLWSAAKQSARGRRRMRFVVAHELGHTFFYGDGSPPQRVNPPDQAEEEFCHRFATGLLVPREAALAADLAPDGLYALAAAYDVSVRVAAWAIARTRPDITLLWLRRAVHPTRGGEETMRVEWGAGERFIAPGESLKSSLATLPPGGGGEVVEELRLGGRRERSVVTAWRFDDSMLAVVRSATEHVAHDHPEQAALF